MTKSIFQEVIDDFEKKMNASNKKAVLLLDNFSGHRIDFSKYDHVKAFFKAPDHCTSSATGPTSVRNDKGTVHKISEIVRRGV